MKFGYVYNLICLSILPQKVAFYLFFCTNYTYFFKKFSARSAESKFKNFERNEWNFTGKKTQILF